jgi:ATP-dependent Clp protease ATP-binding subunit ClpA
VAAATAPPPRLMRLAATAPTTKRPRVAVAARASNNNNQAPINAAAQRLSQMAAEAQRAAQKYARERGLDKKAAAAADEAAKTARAASESAAESWRTFSMRVEREHGVSRRLDKLKRRAEEKLADADAKWRVRRRLRSAADTARRRWPALKAKAGEFLATPSGQVAAVGALVVLIASGALWSLLSLAWVLWWFLIPFNLYRAEAQKRERVAAQQQQQQQQQAASRGGGPFWGGGSRASSSPSPAADRGPVIDAEYTVLWDESGGKGKK